MENKLIKSWRIILVIIIPILFSCATSMQNYVRESPAGALCRTEFIDMGCYSIKAPPGENWGIETDKGKGIVKFQKLKIWALSGKILGSTLIQVMENKILQEKWHLSEEEIADDYRNLEEKIMIEEGVKKGEYKLKEVKKDTTIVDGRKFYTMSYKTTIGTWGEMIGSSIPAGAVGSPLLIKVPIAVENIIYLYFPPDFKEKHNFFAFLISEAYERGSVISIDLKQIYPLINSFKILECAETPLTRAAKAAIKDLEAGIPRCESGHEHALSGGIVTIRPGETICLGMREEGSALLPTQVVAPPVDPARTIILRSWRDGNDTFLTVHNPFPEQIKYRAGILLPGEQRHRKTSSCPVPSGRSSLEHWPHPIVEFLLTDFHFAPDYSKCD